MTMPTTAAALAPELMPMMSGEASGLRSIVWKVTPAMPKRSPASRPSTARGRRSSPTVKDAPGTSSPRMHADDLAGAVERVADHQADREHDDARADGDAPTTIATRAGVPRRAPPGDDAVSSAHSSRTFCRRTIQMKTGAPMTAVMMPTSISSGRATTRPTMSARDAAAPRRRRRRTAAASGGRCR